MYEPKRMGLAPLYVRSLGYYYADALTLRRASPGGPPLYGLRQRCNDYSARGGKTM